MKTIRIFLLLAVLIFPLYSHAQLNAALQSTSISSADDLTVMIAAVEQATPTSFADLSRSNLFGTFYSAQHPEWPALPGNILSLDVWPLGDNTFMLDDRDVDYDSLDQPQTLRRGMGRFSMDDEMDEDEEEDSFTPIDYGTNLWIANVVVSSGYLTGMASNTIADVQYEIQSTTDLTRTNWNSEGFILGSELTNWTALSVLQGSRTNLFIRLRSWIDSDNIGIPDWWQLEYFGYVGIDPYGNPAGDGWNNLQKFEDDMNPNVFYTPPAPRGLTVNYNASSGIATITWLPSPGTVTGYTIKDSDGNSYNISANTNTFQISVPDVPNEYYIGDPTVYETYQIQADYSSGNSTWSDGVSLEPNVLSSQLIGGPSNSVYLAVSGIPKITVAVYLKMADIFSDEYDNDFSHDVTHIIPFSNITNGLFLIPQEWAPPASDEYGNGWFSFSLQSSNAVGNLSAAVWVADYQYYGIEWQPFYDGREGLKQNLNFQFRAANTASPFAYFTHDFQTFDYIATLQTSSNYVCAGFYDINNYNGLYGEQGDWCNLNIYRPFEDNCMYRNFVFSADDVDTNGNLTTGVQNWPAVNILGQFVPSSYIPSTNTIVYLTTDNTRWLGMYPLNISFGQANNVFSYYYLMGFSFQNTPTWTLNTGASNYWGLPFVSAKFFYTDENNNPQSTILYRGDSISDVGPGSVYMETAQPQYQAVECDFWNVNNDYQTNMPGSNEFAVTNQSDLLIVNVGGYLPQIAAFQKLAVLNGYPNVYGYLEQYLDKAYQVDNEGNVTTNVTGMVSPYGTFFATQAGQAALVTMPDVDTGERGTCMVYCVSLNVDANHDGTMDLSFNGADATSPANPMEFWVNNGFSGVVGNAEVTGDTLPDYTYGNIISQRDLENFARLWICGMPTLTNNYQVTLSWANVSSGNPGINLYSSIETNGGIGYLTDTNIAALQSVVTNIATGYGSYPVYSGPGATIAKITNGATFTFPANYFTSNANKYFLFEGAGIGTGELMLTITDANGNQIAQTGVWLDLHDVEDFFEQAVITNNMSGTKSNWTSSVQVVLPAVSTLGNDTNLIVLVHGINVRPWDCIDDAGTVCKRLYWAGYQGKFAEVEWPCNLLTPIPSPLTVDVFNLSELQAYKASTAFTNYIGQLRARFPNYRLNILAHSQGNAVVSEAIRQGMLADTYILTQGALPDSAYDMNAPTNAEMAAYDAGIKITPDLQPMGYHGIYTNLPGRIVNFYNTNDPVLKIWVDDQEQLKPSTYYSFDGTDCWYVDFFFIAHLITDPQEARSMISRSRTLSIGQSGPASAHGVIQSAVDLNAQFGFDKAFPDDHSAQWTWPIQTTLPYFQQVLRSCQILPAP
jgi:hypothetical protein